MTKQSLIAKSKRLAAIASCGNGTPAYNLLQRRCMTTGSKPYKAGTLNYRRAALIGAGITISAAYALAGGARQAHAEQLAKDAQTPAISSTCPLTTMPVAYYDTSTENLNGAKIEFSKLLGAQRVDVDLGSRISHSSTEWSTAPRGELDRFDVIVSPSSTEEVSAIAKICHRRRIPMTAFSGGTSLEGTLAATQGGVCIDFRLMNKVIKVRKNDLDVTVQPGVDYLDLNQLLANEGLFFPPDPGPGAQIGGMMYVFCPPI